MALLWPKWELASFNKILSTVQELLYFLRDRLCKGETTAEGGNAREQQRHLPAKFN
jgi:hypothetical protein